MQKDNVPELAPGVAKRSKKAASALSSVRPHRSWRCFAAPRIHSMEPLGGRVLLGVSIHKQGAPKYLDRKHLATR